MTATRFITAATRIVFMIGTPVRQARSPALFNAHFAKHGMDCVMAPLDVGADALNGLFTAVRSAANCIGVVVTLPHKQTVRRLVDSVSDRAAVLDSVNVVRRNEDGSLFGDMVDGPGFWNGAAFHGFDPKGRTIALAGAGAAGTAIAFGFAEAGGSHVDLLCHADADFERICAMLAGSGATVAPGLPDDPGDCDLVVNATPVGMAHQPGTLFPRMFLAGLPEHAMVADVITVPRETKLLREAGELGIGRIDGYAMTSGQFELLARTLGVIQSD